MRRLPWHVTLRIDRRAVWTALGAALGVAFAFASFAVPAGLRTETVNAEGGLASQDALIARADLAPFDPSTLGLGSWQGVLIVEATLSDARDVTLLAIEGSDLEGIAPGTARPTRPFTPGASSVLVVAPRVLNLTMGPVLSDVHVGQGRLVAHASDLRALDPRLAEGRVTYALTARLPADETEALRSAGFTVSEVPGAEPFFRDSGLEVASDLWLVVVFSAVLVALFVYEFMRSEIRERTREIGLWRALGMKTLDVALLLIARGALLGLAGLAIGLAAATSALLLLRFSTGSGVFATPSAGATLVLCAAFFGATLLGAAIPALAAGRARVAAQLEARA